MDLTGKQVLVAGLGKSGIAAGALLKKMGCMVCLFDGNEKFDRSAWEKTYPVFSDCPLWIGELPDAAVQEMELAVVSPGIPLDTPAILKLQAAGVPVVGEAELAYRFEKGRVAAITGTNGKTSGGRQSQRVAMDNATTSGSSMASVKIRLKYSTGA